jgi:hypothetical protein
MAFAFLVWFLCPDYPRSERTGKWLTSREQKFVEYRLTSNAPVTSDAAFSSKESLETLKDPRLWAFMLTQVLMNTGGFGLSWFLVGESSKLLINLMLKIACPAYNYHQSWICRIASKYFAPDCKCIAHIFARDSF